MCLVTSLPGCFCCPQHGVELGGAWQQANLCEVTKAFYHLGNLSSSLLRYAALPRETVCTENFTPWTKLHPCGASVRAPSLQWISVFLASHNHSVPWSLTNNSGAFCLVSVPYPNQPKCRLLSVLHIILEAIYIPDGVWEWDCILFGGSLISVFFPNFVMYCNAYLCSMWWNLGRSLGGAWEEGYYE